MIECPYCPGKASLTKEKKVLAFRKEEFPVIAHFYKCDSCAEECTTTESDELTITQLYNQYREKHKIPFPEEMKQLRDKYKVSAAKMGEILGFGANTYGNYEKGEMPTLANANLIKTASDPEVFLKLLENLKDEESGTFYTKTSQHLHTLIKERSAGHKDCLSLFCVPPSSFTGFKVFDATRLKNILINIISSCNPLFNERIKLNKLLFYIDFSHYAKFGRSVSGLTYQALGYGPAPASYNQIFAFMSSEGEFTCAGQKLPSGHVIELFSTDAVFDSEIFSECEIETMRIVISKFRNLSTWDIKELSHQEKAWTALQNEKSIISYQDYAFDLRAFS